MKEYVERNSQHRTFTDPIIDKQMSEVLYQYNLFENKVLIKAITGASMDYKVNSSIKDVFRTIVNNHRQDRQYWIQAIEVVKLIYLNRYRQILLMGLYPLMFFTFWLFTRMRYGSSRNSTEEKDQESLEKVKCTFSTLLFYMSGLISSLMTFTLL
jgi:hypothetical protein